MEEKKQGFQTIDEYISQYSPEIQERLMSVRQAIKESAPNAKEKISWGMPTFEFYGNLVHFAANKKHIGLYPGASGVEAFQVRLKEYMTSKGAIQFPNDKPIPLDLIKEIVAYRLDENKQLYHNRKENI